MPKVTSMAFVRLPALVLAAFILLSGCSVKRSGGGDIVAYVNKDPIYESDLKREIAMRAKYDPEFKLTPETASEQLDAMIDRKIMVQAAMEKGLAREDRFVDTIRTIWEHTLIRDFIEYKKKEFADYLFATDEEIKSYYNNMAQKASFVVFKSRDKQAVDAAYNKYLSSGDTTGWQMTGPVAYDDIGSMVLIDAFEMSEGQAGKFSDDTDNYAIVLVKKEKTDIAPMDTLKTDIEKRVIIMKERRLFDDWLRERKKKAKITIKAVSQ